MNHYSVNLLYDIAYINVFCVIFRYLFSFTDLEILINHIIKRVIKISAKISLWRNNYVTHTIHDVCNNITLGPRSFGFRFLGIKIHSLSDGLLDFKSEIFENFSKIWSGKYHLQKGFKKWEIFGKFSEVDGNQSKLEARQLLQILLRDRFQYDRKIIRRSL